MQPRVKAAALAATFTIATGPVWAEVCDKAVPRWDGSPVTVGQELFWTIVSPLFLTIALAAIGALFVFRSRLATIAIAAIAAVIGLLDVTLMDNEATRFAIFEGCMTGYATWAAAYFVLATSLGAIGLRLGKKQKKT
jgi:hypothetical protein